MAQPALGKAHRKGISLADLFRLFPDDDAAQAWPEEQCWGDDRANASTIANIRGFGEGTFQRALSGLEQQV